MKGLIIKSPWIDLILSGDKIWEIRGNNTKIRGKIALIKSGSGHIYGTVDLIDCFQIDLVTYQKSVDKHKIPSSHLSSLPYKKTYAWILNNPQIYESPIKYTHPQGAVIWVNI